MVGIKILAFLLGLIVLSVYGAPTADLVTNLPGLNFQPNFVHYSGYLKAAPTRQYHYWFTRHQYATANSPVLLWLNGGPGCSSLGGLIEELGPFHVSDNGNTVYENPYAWNKAGHVIFLESPAGVGFSYATDGDTSTDDDQTAKDNHNALIDFFTNKFPELKSNDFYVTGESYAGVYIPTLAVLLANDKTNFPNFKGVAIGNGYYNVQLNVNTQPALFYYHGIARQNLFDQAITQCCNGNPYKCDYNDMDGECGRLANELLAQANDLDPYNLYNVCYLDGGSRSKRNFIRNKLMKNAIAKGIKSPKQAASLPLCAQDTNTETYLNRPEVRTALHIPSNVGHWYDCANIEYNQIYVDVTPQFKTLIQNNVRILVYNGDVDSVCNIIMNEQFIAGLGLTVEGGTNRKKWTYNGSFEDAYNYISNVAGFFVKYSEGLDFVSVRGSGHFVPEDRPRQAIQMIYNFINNIQYSEPVPFSTLPQPLTNRTNKFTLVGNICTGLLHIPDVLVNEENTGQPGVKSRLSPKAINHIVTFLTNNLLPEIIDLKLDIIPQKLEIENGDVSIVDMSMILKNQPREIHIDLKEPNNVIINWQEMDILAKALLSGKIFEHNLSGKAIISLSNLKIFISVSILSNAHGSPNVRIQQCKTRGLVEISFENVPEQLQRPLQGSLATEGLGLLEGFLCSRVELIVNERINTRFGFMNSKINMAALTKQIDEQEFIEDMLTRMRASRMKKREIMYYYTEELMYQRNNRREKRDFMISSFNVSRANTLFLDYTIKNIRATPIGLEIETSGEVSLNGRGGTPFGPVDFQLPEKIEKDAMLQLGISDFMTNSLLYHGHTIGLFDTRVDHTTPVIGSILKTSCSLSTGQLFCLGDMFPTLRKIHPNHFLGLSFSTVSAPVILFRPPHSGGIDFTLFGKIVMSILDMKERNETEVAEMGIDVSAKMQIRLTSTVVKPKLAFNSIKLSTLSPGILLQEELDDAVLLAREVIQRLVNDILREGIPIPIHPLFKLNKPLVKILNRAILINTNFTLNESLMKQLIGAEITATKN